MKKYHELKKIILYTVIIVVFTFAVTNFFPAAATHRSIPGIPDPIQTETEGSVNFTLDGYNIDVYYLYENGLIPSIFYN